MIPFTPNMMVGLIGFIVLLILVFLRVWIGFAMFAVGFVGMCVLKNPSYAGSVIASEPFTQATSYSLTCMPLFAIMGSVICDSGMGEKLYTWAKAMIGHIRGGLGMATIGACAVFAAICGNSQITAMTFGKIAYPEMRKAGYSEEVAVGGIAAGGGIGIMIPPSVGFIVYGMLTEQSVGKLFMAGMIPGILQALLLMSLYFGISTFKPSAAPASQKATAKERLAATGQIWSIMLLMIIMLGGIYGGFFTATEAGAIGAIGAIVIAATMRKLSVRSLYKACVDGVRMTATIMIVLAAAKCFLRFITVSNLISFITAYITSLNVSKYVILLGIILVYFIMGCIFDIMSGIMLTVPFLFPIMTGLGFDPIWFGVFVVAMMELGEISPPIGLSCFMLADTVQLPVTKIFKGVIPFLLMDFVLVFIICAFPKVCLLLT